MSVPNKKEQVTDIVKKKNKWLMPVIVAGVAWVGLDICGLADSGGLRGHNRQGRDKQ